MGIREIVGLAILALALFITLSFQLPGVSDADTPSLDDLRPALTSVPTEAPNGALLPQPTAWKVTYLSDDGQGLAREVSLTALDLAIEKEPLDDFPAEGFIARAEATIELPPGDYYFVLETRASVVVRIDERQATSSNGTGRIEELTVPVQHARGDLRIRIDARDIDGPFLLRWK